MTHRPEGLHSVTPQIIERDGAAAIGHCKRACGVIQYARKPMPGTNKIVHARIGIRDSPIFLMDEHAES